MSADGRLEAVVAAILQRQGFWTLTSVKVELTKAEKRTIGRHSSPRWEIDVVAYSGRSNALRVVECKSFLDSPGVECGAFDGTNVDAAKRYKLFCEPTLRRVGFGRLKRQLETSGFCAPRAKTKLCLAAGKIRGDERWLQSHFERKGWILWGPSFIGAELETMRDMGYENSVAAVVAKLLLRVARGRSQQPLSTPPSNKRMQLSSASGLGTVKSGPPVAVRWNVG